jgi:site-specific DNA recombinase
MRAVCYSRVSSKYQRDRHTIESQLRILPQFVASHGWALARPIDHYVDDGRTAKAGHLEARHAFQRLLRDAHAREFDVVAVIDIDRLTRSEDLTERGQVLGAFQRARVQIAVASSGQVLDLASSQGDLFSGLSAFFAAEENRKRRHRTVEGKLTAIARGKKPAGPTPFGYRYDRTTGVWSIHEQEADLVRECYRRVIAHESCEDIARDFTDRGLSRPRGGMWIRERVHQILRPRTYCGEWRADKARGLVIQVPRIIPDSMWHDAQEALKRHKKRGLVRTKHVYLLEGLAVCALCGARIGVASAIKRGPSGDVRAPARYVCGHRRRPMTGASSCPLPILRVDDIDARLWDGLVTAISKPELVREALAFAHEGTRAGADAAVVAAAEARLEKLRNTEGAVLSRFRRGVLSEEALDAELEQIARDRKAAEATLERVRRELQALASPKPIAAGTADALLERLRPRLAAVPIEERRSLVRALVEPGGVALGVWEIRAVVHLPVGGASDAARPPASLPVVPVPLTL